jgi:hypothetical protein
VCRCGTLCVLNFGLVRRRGANHRRGRLRRWHTPKATQSPLWPSSPARPAAAACLATRARGQCCARPLRATGSPLARCECNAAGGAGWIAVCEEELRAEEQHLAPAPQSPLQRAAVSLATAAAVVLTGFGSPSGLVRSAGVGRVVLAAGGPQRPCAAPPCCTSLPLTRCLASRTQQVAMRLGTAGSATAGPGYPGGQRSSQERLSHPAQRAAY